MEIPKLVNSKTKQGATIIAVVLAIMQVLETSAVIPLGTSEALVILAPALLKIGGSLLVAFGLRDAIAKAGL